MARGDVHIFAAFDQKTKAGGSFNLSSDTLKIAFVSNTTVPTVSTADPRYGSGGSTDLSTGAVATGTGYTGPVTLTGVTLTRANGVTTLAASNVTVAQDASGFTNAYYGIIYDSTVAVNYAIGYVDLGGPVSNQNGPVNINWNAAGIATWTAA